MSIINFRYKLKYFSTIVFVLLALSIQSCKKTTAKRTVIYQNNFESGDSVNLTNAKITTYLNSKVLGRFNTGFFTLQLDNIPEHDLIEVSFDLYIHDSWDGNSIGNEIAFGGPDIWEMTVDGKKYISTTFSNSVCNGSYCIQQSYPYNYPYLTNPGTGAADTNLPPFCTTNPGTKTSLYKIKKVIKHKKGNLVLTCMDKLVQTNTEDPLCDESWSLDNIIITAL
ncbi:hypothetical protein [Rubrolithibacter danxiaensis]|uniref:hypothetical protein n=1 Tax=Rubrolithibacter danxiaensis TaxID=3390805 RepID=UPI003BF81EDF